MTAAASTTAGKRTTIVDHHYGGGARGPSGSALHAPLERHVVAVALVMRAVLRRAHATTERAADVARRVELAADGESVGPAISGQFDAAGNVSGTLRGRESATQNG